MDWDLESHVSWNVYLKQRRKDVMRQFHVVRIAAPVRTASFASGDIIFKCGGDSGPTLANAR